MDRDNRSLDDAPGRSGRARSAACSHTAARLCALAGFLALGVVGVAFPANAHVTITPSTTDAGAHSVLEVSVAHGCEDSPTTEIVIQMPPEINSVTPNRTALWEVEKQVERLDPPVADSHGNEIEERVASVTYRTDTPLPNGYRDTFELTVQLPDDVGATLVFPIIQTCVQGESAWIEVAQDGQDVVDLELPAPDFVISAAGEGGCGDLTTAAATTSDSESDDRSAAAPDSQGADALMIDALAAGLLGSVLGGAALVGQRRRT